MRAALKSRSQFEYPIALWVIAGGADMITPQKNRKIVEQVALKLFALTRGYRFGGAVARDQVSTKALATVSAVMSAMGTASGHLEYRSIIVSA
ncbi:hypothetical protein TKK_0016995 [Trichogramma kaykai]